MMDPRIGGVIAWCRDAVENWFSQSPTFDAAFRTVFIPLYKIAMAGDLADWQDTPEVCLALLILLDHYPSNTLEDASPFSAVGTLAGQALS